MRSTRWRSQALLVLSVCVIFVSPIEATAARYVRAEITLDGKTLLRGSTGDNGRVDADGVWEYLKSMKFKATEDFERLAVDPSAKQTILTSNAPRGQLGTVVVYIAYGGKAMRRKLKLVRVPIDKQGRQWALDPAEVDKMFDDRLIRRSDAARLKDPKASKR